MILYNIRKNGPYEYDKFILNIYQIINDVRDEQISIDDGIKKVQDNLDTINDTYTSIQDDVNKIQTMMRVWLY